MGFRSALVTRICFQGTPPIAERDPLVYDVPSMARILLTLFLALPLSALAAERESITPILLSVHQAPIPFHGSDGWTHLVYELWVTNFSSAESTLVSVDVLGGGRSLLKLDRADIERRLQPVGLREPTGTLPKSTQALLFVHVRLPAGTTIPEQLSHRVTARVLAAPPGHEEITEVGGATTVDRRPVIRIGPPLLNTGTPYISADSCCDASRHTRAALPVNGSVFVAQRFAVDWEQLDKDHRIYSGPQEKLESYTIFGKPAIAVADATVASVTDGLPEQTPGKYPTDISLTTADGNCVILDLGEQRYALYAHLRPGSIKVRPGEHVHRGQILGSVGNTGNSVAPHLHFHVMDGPSPLASNGLPYEIDQFEISGKTPGTEAFDEAEAKGTPLAIVPQAAEQIHDALPLDQMVVKFGDR
jgi:hypothetical protein